MEKQISEFTLVELKSMAYDQISQLEICKNNLNVLNQEIARRLSPQTSPQSNVESLPPGSIQAV